jgi:hypothetical protein
VFQAVQIGGATAILVAFAAAQAGWLGQRSVLYLVLNLVGSAILGVQARLQKQWGFLLLEGAWALVSAAGLILRG